MLATSSEALQLRPGTQIFEFDTSTNNATYRLELSNGTHFQIGEMLYHLLECLRVPMDHVTLATALKERTGRELEPETLAQLSQQLVDEGLVIQANAEVSQEEESANEPASFLGLHFRKELISPQLMAPAARVFSKLFGRKTSIAMVSISIAIHAFIFAEVGFPPNVNMEAISWPLLYTLVLGSILFHEIGHLAACHRWQCPHGPLGFGLYFFNPVFYVDVTAAWRLTRWQRAAVDVGGVYVQMLCVPLFFAVYLLTTDPTYLFAILLIDLIALGNFEPFMKLDGYWLLSDLTGVPNLHTRTGEETKRFWGWLLWKCRLRKQPPASSHFSDWSRGVRAVIVIYVALSIALWPLIIVALVPMLAQMLATYPALWTAAFQQIGQSLITGNLSDVLAQFRVLFLPTLALANLGFLVKMGIDRWRRSKNKK